MLLERKWVSEDISEDVYVRKFYELIAYAFGLIFIRIEYDMKHM